MTWSVADIRFDPESHTSVLQDGSPVPHVTAVLGATGVSTDFEALGAALGPRAEENIRARAQLGQAVHADSHAYDDDDLDAASVHDLVRPYLAAWAQVRRDKSLKPITRERRLYHALYHYTGAMDGVFLAQDSGKVVLADIKLGDPEDAAAHLQTAAYEAAYLAEDLARHIDERWAIWLRPDLVRVPYRIVNYSARPEAPLDFSKFIACLCTYNEQPARRRRAA